MSSKLFYYGTRDEVELGDRVALKSILLRRKRTGTVVCVPDKTALELNAEEKMPEDWLVRFDDGSYTGWMYHPEEAQPSKRLKLVERATGPVEQISNEELDGLDLGELRKSGFLVDLLAWATIIIVGTAIIVYLMS